MWAWVLSIVGYLSADLVKKLLTGAGIGLVSAYLFNELIQWFISRIVTNMGGLGGSFVGLLGLFGFDQALSIIIGSLVMRASIMAMGVSFQQAK